MRALLLTLLAAAPAAAQQPPAEAAPAAAVAPALSTAPAAPALPEPHAAQVRALMKDLALLLEHGPQARPDRLERLSESAAKLDEAVKDALGRPLLARVAAAEQAARDAALAAAAAKALQDLRYRLRAAYAARGGTYPKDLAELGDLPAPPLPGHPKPGAARAVDSKKYDEDPSKAVEDGGGWLYFNNPASANYGLLLLDCSHKDAAGTEFYRY